MPAGRGRLQRLHEPEELQRPRRRPHSFQVKARDAPATQSDAADLRLDDRGERAAGTLTAPAEGSGSIRREPTSAAWRARDRRLDAGPASSSSGQVDVEDTAADLQHQPQRPAPGRSPRHAARRGACTRAPARKTPPATSAAAAPTPSPSTPARPRPRSTHSRPTRATRTSASFSFARRARRQLPLPARRRRLRRLHEPRRATTGLADGPHSFQVKATRRRRQPEHRRQLRLDDRHESAPTLPPRSTQPGQPDELDERQLQLLSAERCATFRCQLDGAGVQRLHEPEELHRARSGRRILPGQGAGRRRQRAIACHATAGRSTRRPPQPPSIDREPADPTDTTTASCQLHLSARRARRFLCRLDGTPYAACTSPRATAAVAAGAHTFDARGDATPPATRARLPAFGVDGRHDATRTRSHHRPRQPRRRTATPTFSGVAGTATGDLSAVTSRSTRAPPPSRHAAPVR